MEANQCCKSGADAEMSKHGKPILLARRKRSSTEGGALVDGTTRGNSPVETARREVMEECGLADLQVLKYIGTTYHIYEEKQKQILKHSHWYEMFTRTIKLVPQTEEGISEAIWSDANTTERLLANTYPNIRLLFGR